MNTATFNGPVFNGAAFNGSAQSGTTIVATFRESVIYVLNQISALTAIVGKRIYWADPSQRAIYPNVCVRVPTREWVRNLAGSAGVSTATVDITVQSNLVGGEKAVIAASKAIFDNLEGFRGNQNGVAWLTCFYDDENDDADPPVDASDRWVYSITLTYRIKHRVPVPTSVTQTNV